MSGIINFRGQSGRAWSFQRRRADSPWAAEAGIAVFAAADACGWRVFRIVDLSGRPHDVQPIWALSEAERYGANAVFVACERDPVRRAAIIADLEAGFSTVCRKAAPAPALAA
jgi:hypothetical protein